jgi:hypothetical protein
MYYDTDIKKPMWWNEEDQIWEDAKTEDVDIIITVGDTVSTLQDAVNMLIGHGGQHYKILLPEGVHTLQIPTKDDGTPENINAVVDIIGIPEDKTKVTLEISGSSYSHWWYFTETLTCKHVTIHNPNEILFASFVGDEAHFLDCDIGNTVLIPQARCYLEVKRTNTLDGARNAVWAYENSFVEINTSNLYRTDITAFSAVDLFFRYARLGSDDSDNPYGGRVITMHENSVIVRTHLTIENCSEGISLDTGSYVKNAGGITFTNVDTKFNIPAGLMKGDGTYIADGTPIVLDGHAGPTEGRPAEPELGFDYFDSDIGKPIWWNGTDWIDASGNTV